jgi:hypothetical protein
MLVVEEDDCGMLEECDTVEDSMGCAFQEKDPGYERAAAAATGTLVVADLARHKPAGSLADNRVVGKGLEGMAEEVAAVCEARRFLCVGSTGAEGSMEKQKTPVGVDSYGVEVDNRVRSSPKKEGAIGDAEDMQDDNHGACNEKDVEVALWKVVQGKDSKEDEAE